METIDLYKAIASMQELSREGKTFNIIHATINRDTGQGNGQRRVRRARLRPAAKVDDVTHAGFKIFYCDLDEHDIQPMTMEQAAASAMKTHESFFTRTWLWQRPQCRDFYMVG